MNKHKLVIVIIMENSKRPPSDASRRAKAKYYQKNKEKIREKTRMYHTNWCKEDRRAKREWNLISLEFLNILF